ncbi:MAG: hypothetical protein ACR2G4_04250 [Pyrinomonadaceae bacterium]
MRRKFGIVLLVGITVLAGTQEAVQQLQCLKSSVGHWTRAGLWSGLIVYAQPVSDGSLPSPQLYYLMPESSAPITPDATLAGNNSSGEIAKPGTKNNHAATATAATHLEVEEMVKPEFITKELPLDVVASNFVAPQIEQLRVFEEIAKNEPHLSKLPLSDSGALAKVVLKEFKAAQVLGADAARFEAEQERVEALKVKARGEWENVQRRMEIKVLRRTERAPRPERIRVLIPFAGKRELALPEISSVGCEKTRTAETAPAPEATTNITSAAASAVVVATGEFESESAHIIVDVESPAAAPPPPVSTNWALDCGTEPFKEEQ